MLKTFMTWQRRQQRRFYDGPAIFNYPGRRMRGYRSPNLIAAQWLHAFVVTRFTPAGRLLSVISAVFFVGGLTTMLMPMYMLSFALFSLFLIDFVIGWLVRPRVSISRTLPSAAAAYSEVRVDYLLVNQRRRPIWDLYIDALPLPRPLKHRDGVPFVARLGGHESLAAHAYLRTGGRGSFLLPLPLADSPFPFGLWRWGSRGAANKPLVVYPDFAPLCSLRLPGGRQHQRSGSLASNRAGQSMEFLGTREYRYGDNPRHLHARSWARLGAPVVKEFREEQLLRVSLVIDLFPPGMYYWQRFLARENRQFEAAISLAAAICHYLQTHGYCLDLLVPDETPLFLPGRSERGHLWSMLAALACLQPCPGETFPEAQEQWFLPLETACTSIAILLDWDAARAATVQALETAGQAVRIFFIDQPTTDDWPPEAVICSSAAIAAGKLVDV